MQRGDATVMRLLSCFFAYIFVIQRVYSLEPCSNRRV